MSRIYLPGNASKARLREAEHARRNRAEIVRELSWGRVSRRDLIKMGVFTAAGMLAPIGGLNPFVKSVAAAPVGPTGRPAFLFGWNRSARCARASPSESTERAGPAGASVSLLLVIDPTGLAASGTGVQKSPSSCRSSRLYRRSRERAAMVASPARSCSSVRSL